MKEYILGLLVGVIFAILVNIIGMIIMSNYGIEYNGWNWMLGWISCTISTAASQFFVYKSKDDQMKNPF